jgi:hypothetical protein
MRDFMSRRDRIAALVSGEKVGDRIITRVDGAVSFIETDRSAPLKCSFSGGEIISNILSTFAFGGDN